MTSILAVENDDNASRSFCPSLDGSLQSCSSCVIPSNPPDVPGCSNRPLAPAKTYYVNATSWHMASRDDVECERKFAIKITNTNQVLSVHCIPAEPPKWNR